MIRGLYTAGAGMGVEQARLDALANNLINATTSGYKKDNVVQTSFPQLFLVQKQKEATNLAPAWEYVGRSHQGAAVRQVVTDFTPGLLQETGDFRHLALTNQNCFFVLSSPVPDDPGRELYTRDGGFSVDGEGYLVTGRGERVLGENGPLFTEEEKFRVNEEGAVFTPNQGETGRLRLVEFADLNILRKTGNNCYLAPAGTAVPAANPQVRQGFLEQANSVVVSEMVQMITATRAYEANARVFQAHNDLLGLAVNQVGSLK